MHLVAKMGGDCMGGEFGQRARGQGGGAAVVVKLAEFRLTHMPGIEGGQILQMQRLAPLA